MNKLLKGGLVMFGLFADSSIKSSVAALSASLRLCVRLNDKKGTEK